MKSKPILFSTPMVQAILEGRKTQTRRILKPQPKEGYIPKIYKGNDEQWHLESRKSPTELEYIDWKVIQKGTILWVRESFTKVEFKDQPTVYLYKANPEHQSMKWKPSIHMPKEACRLFLKVTNVRVERLWDISEEDAKAEGCSFEIVHNIKEYKDYLNPDNTFPVYAKLSFISLWEKINGVKSLEENPFVWVIEFERIEKPENF